MKANFLSALFVKPGMVLYAQHGDAAAASMSFRMIYSTAVSDYQSFDQPVRVGADREAVFPGGNRAMFKYLARGFQYPLEAIEQSLEGHARVRFTVDRYGNVVSPEVIQPLHPLLDEEIVRLVRDMPRWAPGIRYGLPCDSVVEVPMDLVLPR